MSIPGVILNCCQYGNSVLKPKLTEQFFMKFKSAAQRLRQDMLTLRDDLKLLTHLPPLGLQYWAYIFVQLYLA